jgi:peroxiredoxin
MFANKNWTAKKSLLGITTAGLMLLTVACGGSSVQGSSNQPSPSVSESVSDVSKVAVRPGAAAPDFTGTDSNGQNRRLSDFKGKVVVLEWTNHQCPFVGKHYGAGNMQQLQKEATSKGVVWLSIVSSAPGQQGYVTARQANDLTKSRNAMPTAVILDPEGKIGRLYNARTTPHMYVIGQDGTMMYMGAIDDAPSSQTSDVKKANNYVRTALDQVLNGRPVSTSVTQPYGCSVKYSS